MDQASVQQGREQAGATAAPQRPARRRAADRFAAGVLVLCLAAAGVWQVLAKWSSRPFDRFTVTPGHFATFSPRAGDGWRVQTVDAVSYDPATLCLFSYTCARGAGRPVTVRLLHGYNMPECMEIKGYSARLMADKLAAEGTQLWQLKSSSGEVSIWSTAMVDGGAFAPTGMDTRSMPFPRVATRGSSRWDADGLKWRHLRHPVATLCAMVRTEWNNSRCDPLAFLKLRRRAWGSDEVFTLVAEFSGYVCDGNAAEVIRDVEAAQAFVWTELRAWRASGDAGERADVRGGAGAGPRRVRRRQRPRRA